MPYYLRAKTYLRYAEEAFQKALQKFGEKPEAAVSEFRDSFLLAAKALWALSQIEVPKEKPSPEDILEALSRAVEPEIVSFFKQGWKEFEAGLDPEKARSLAGEALRYAREVLAPLVGFSTWSRNL